VHEPVVFNFWPVQEKRARKDNNKGNKMKLNQDPFDILKSQFTYISGAYEKSPVKNKGVIQLLLTHADMRIECFFFADGYKIGMEFGKHQNPTCTLSTTLYAWLDLSSNRLNPVWGAITGRLKFKGRTAVFNQLISKPFLYELNSGFKEDAVSKFEISIKSHSIPKKILVINGSPRGQNGFTYYYLEKLLEGIRRTNAQLELIDICKYRILPCTGCYNCWKESNGSCIQKDDVGEIYSKLDNADHIIFAFPLYHDGVPGILKNFIDRGLYRMYPYMIEGDGITRHPRRLKRDQKMTIFSICGFPENKHFEAVKTFFKQKSHNSHIPISNQIYRSACMYLYSNPLEYQKLNHISEALKTAGEELGRTGLIEDKLIKRIEANVNRLDFQKISSKFWDNVILKNPSELPKV
jgi:multimeric flavodoxin WrbA